MQKEGSITKNRVVKAGKNVADSVTNFVVTQIKTTKPQSSRNPNGNLKTRSINGPKFFSADKPTYVVPIPTQRPYLTRKIASNNASHEMFSIKASFIIIQNI